MGPPSIMLRTILTVVSRSICSGMFSRLSSSSAKRLELDDTRTRNVSAHQHGDMVTDAISGIYEKYVDTLEYITAGHAAEAMTKKGGNCRK